MNVNRLLRTQYMTTMSANRRHVACTQHSPKTTQTNSTTTEEKKLSELTDQELLQAAKKMKSAAQLNAVLIGFLLGILVYSIVKNTVGFAILIPLFLVYKWMNNSNMIIKHWKPS